MDEINRDTLFVGLTRPQMLLGVTYGYLIGNAVITTELFLVFKSIWVLLAAVIVHVVGWIGCLRDPRFFDIWLLKTRHCPRHRNFRIWGCNSFRP